MLDIKFIRQNPKILEKTLKARNCKFDLKGFLALDVNYRSALGDIEQLRASQNKINQELQAILKDKKDPAPKISESKQIKEKLESLKADFSNIEKSWRDQLLRIPNINHESLPVGGAPQNQVLRQSSELKRFDFKPKDHIVLAEKLDIIDFKRSVKLSGSNFILLKGKGAQLERALINFMLDLHTREHGYREIFPPVLVNPASMEATGQLPNLKEDMYCLQQDGLYLIPTAEVPLTNIHRDEVLPEKDLPVKYAAFTPCFRREAGSYGKDTRGLMRVHEFNKVELVKFVKPQDSYNELEGLLADACKVLDELKLPYRTVLLATADISFASAKTYDIELYAPGMDKWLEVSSCSNFESFQARRGNIRYKEEATGKKEFVHTLNGSGVALPRLMAALLENYQQEDGSILVPDVLRKYMGQVDKIEP
ncbi:MAG: serine--tRNA ligase [Candidatus Omnitrophota bacterium]